MAILQDDGWADVTDNQKADTESLLRVLVERSSGSLCAGAGTDFSAEEIVLDVAIDGARYLLVRLPAATETAARLSPREQEIVRLVALGHSNKIIGTILNISSWTVCTHVRRIFAKIGVGSRAAMVAQLLGAAGSRENLNPPQAHNGGGKRSSGCVRNRV